MPSSNPFTISRRAANKPISTYSDADLRFFRVFSANTVENYWDIYDILGKVSSGEWSIEFVDEYRSSVLAFAKQIFKFISCSPERIFINDSDRKGYELFMREYKGLMEKSSQPE